MSISCDHIKETLDGLVRQVQMDHPAETATTSTRRAILSLAEMWPRIPKGQDHENLNLLCHSVAVRRKITVDLQGKSPQRSEEETLSAEWWSLLIAVLLAYSQCEERAGETSYGLALKSLNTALKALDLVKRMERINLDADLYDWADDLLGSAARGSHA